MTMQNGKKKRKAEALYDSMEFQIVLICTAALLFSSIDIHHIQIMKGGIETVNTI